PEPAGMERSRSLGPALPPYEPLSEGLDMEGLPRSTVVSVEPSPPPPPPPRREGAGSPAVACASRDRKVLGDYSGALSYGSTAKYLNITALLLNIFLIIILVALIASSAISMVNLFNQEQERHPFLNPT
ncbi:UNVERIFIED_CONTAM: Interferon-induced transmembrane protein 1, partial [Eudyptes robustus]